MPSIADRSLLQVLSRISRRSSPCRIISHRRFPNIRRPFHASIQLRASSWPSEGSEPIRNNAKVDDSIENSQDDQGQANVEDAQSENLRFYGSARRRALRNGRLRFIDDNLPVSLPQNFIDRKVILLRDNNSDQCVRPLPAELKLHPFPEPGAGAGDETPDACLTQRESTVESNLSLGTHRYEVPADVWNELDLSIKAGLRPPRPETLDSPRREKCHIIVNAICDNGHGLVTESIKQLSRRHKADLVVLDALDISRIATDHHHGNPDIKALSDLGFQVYKEEASAFETDSFIDNDRTEFMDLADPDSDGLPPIEPMAGSGKKPFSVSTSVHFNLSDSLGPLFEKLGLNRAKNTPSKSILIDDIDDHALVYNQQKEKRIWNSFISQILRAPTAKTSNSQDPDAAPEAQGAGRVIVLIQDIQKVQQARDGSKFLTKILETVNERRRLGQSILLVGSNSIPLDDYRQYSETSYGDESEEAWQSLALPPIMNDADSRTIFWMDNRRWYRDVNERQLREALRLRKSDNLPNPVDGVIFTQPQETEDKLPVILTAKFRIDDRYLSSGQINRMATFITGNDTTAPDQPFGISEIRKSLDQLWRSDAARAAWVNHETRRTREMSGSAEAPQDDKLNQIAKSCTKHERKLLGGVVEAEKIKTTFGDVHVPIETVEALKTLTTLSLIRPDAFSYGVLASDKIPGLLLYGPPGTGKTLLAKAVAKESGARVLEVSGAEINDMYVGESEKNIKALFSLAKKLTPCVIFIDEADAIFSSRTQSRQRTAHREMINQFLREWDGMSNDSGGAFIMVATNRPFDLDDAVLRRLPRRLLVDLPGQQDRLEILKIHLKDETLASEVDLQSISHKTPFYSGSDLKNLAVAAALNAVREENDLAKNHTLTNPDQPYVYPPRRTITNQHFEKALEEITASISDDMDTLKAIKKFDEQFGDKRGRKKKGGPKWGFRNKAEADRVLDTVKVRE